MADRRDRDPTRALRWRAEAWLARLLIAAFGRLPERSALAAGALGGRAALRLSRRHRERARSNIRIVYPDWSDERVDRLLRASFAELGRIAVEWARHSQLSPEQLLARVEFHGLEHLEKALQRGRGVILVSAHYGHWELIPSALRFRLPQVEVTPTGRTLVNPGVQAMVASRRNLGGGFVLERDTAEIIRALRRNAAVGILVDLRRSRKRGGVLVPFLGRRAWTPHGPATIARRTGAAVIPTFVRRSQGAHHRIELLPELEQPRGPDLLADTAAATAALNDVLGRFILAEPSSWLWVHRRWRGSPDVARNVYRNEAGGR
jgi:KDO2-lipid IV(A) lauroyltransferase